MKIKLLAIVFLFAARLAAQPAQAPGKCFDFDCMMKRAGEHLAAGRFEDALSAVNAAKHYSGAENREGKRDSMLNAIFFKIEAQRIKAEAAEKVARAATERARALAVVAQKARDEAEKSKITAELQRDSARTARLQVDTLVKKGLALEHTFSDSSAYDYLYQTGRQYFQWDKIAQSRDYRNALTYFALARFLEPSDTLDFLVRAAQNGFDAEGRFLEGRMDSARFYFQTTRLLIDSSGLVVPDFELERLRQIETVNALFAGFQRQNKPGDTKNAVLDGNWHTIPEGFSKYKDLALLVLKNNPGNFRRFPTALAALPKLSTLILSDCPEIRKLDNWQPVPALSTLWLQNNPNLYALENLDRLPRLTELRIDSCSALTHLEGCRNLETFTTQKCPQARVAELLLQNPGLCSLALADLPEKTLDLGFLADLESLSLTRMEVANLQGLEKNTRLKELKISELQQLATFQPPTRLHSVFISNCNGLTRLDRWAQSDSLTKILLFENASLQTLPDWKRFPNLTHVLIQDDPELRRVKDLRSLKNIRRLYVINNENIRTNSLHAGFGFDWGIKPSGVKIEFEHRRRIRFKDQDLGYKALVVGIRKYADIGGPEARRKVEGTVAGAALSYYSSYLAYASIGFGVAWMQGLDAARPKAQTVNLTWINQLGFQFAPRFLRKDKVSINMDLYTVFQDWDDYFIQPSFGLTYYYTLGMSRKTTFFRPGDGRRSVLVGRKRVRLDGLPGAF